MLNEQDLRERVDTWRDLGEGLAMLEKIVEGEPLKEGKEMRCGMTKKLKKQRREMGLRVCVGGCASRNRAAKEMETFKIRIISMFIIFLPHGV